MKQSAGLLIYRQKNGKVEVLLVHPGGPFWARKDEGAWDIPKGEIDEGEEPFQAAQREFKEEIGTKPPQGKVQDLGKVKIKSGKEIQAWAIKGDLDLAKFKSDNFTMEWPPRSGKTQEFPEVDKAEWFDLATAKHKLNPAKVEFISRLETKLGLEPSGPSTTSSGSSGQATLV